MTILDVLRETAIFIVFCLTEIPRAILAIPVAKLVVPIEAVLLLVAGALAIKFIFWAGNAILIRFNLIDPAGLSPEERKRHQEAVARYPEKKILADLRAYEDDCGRRGVQPYDGR